MVGRRKRAYEWVVLGGAHEASNALLVCWPLVWQLRCRFDADGGVDVAELGMIQGFV